MRATWLILFALSLVRPLLAQELPLKIGMLIPYGTQIGGEVGTAFLVGEWETDDRMHQLWLAPQLGSFTFPGVESNFLLQTDLEYQLRSREKRLFPKAALGIGYLLGLERVDGVVDLGNGGISHANRVLNYLLPSLSLGAGFRSARRNLEYHFAATYGQKVGFSLPKEAFFGLEMGLVMFLNDSSNE